MRVWYVPDLVLVPSELQFVSGVAIQIVAVFVVVEPDWKWLRCRRAWEKVSYGVLCQETHFH